MARNQPLKLAILFLYSFFALQVFSISIYALNVGIQSSDSDVSVSKECSRKCESEFCSVPPFLRYGKYCGLLYSGCPGEKPCDGLDACCLTHDACVQAKNKITASPMTVVSSHPSSTQQSSSAIPPRSATVENHPKTPDLL
ncbi:phospholipase A2-alpha isoform X3 [Magnolia sinica]|uniref:phospholipase A2-alpha isoform X3 n=1 Tax=Magnolia sinica TaxID=86752 RepID=UPI002659EC82|nr:phospholipase A2-alpha isoform X3 [Magnolia sinica]